MRRITVVTRPTVAEAAAGPLVSDTFDRPDSTTSLGTADTGQVWAALDGTWGIETNRAYTPGGGLDRQAVVESGASDVTVEVTVPVVTTGAGVVGRSVDGSNYWLWTWEAGVPRMALYKRVGGGHTLVGSYSLAALPDGSRLGLRMTGTTVVGLLDGMDVLTVTDSAHQTATRHGMRVYNSDITRLDNFRVEAA